MQNPLNNDDLREKIEWDRTYDNMPEDFQAWETVYEAHSHQIKGAVKRAYDEWPTNSMRRHEIIAESLEWADRAFRALKTPSHKDNGKLLFIYAGIMAADSLEERAYVDEVIESDWLSVWKRTGQEN